MTPKVYSQFDTDQDCHYKIPAGATESIEVFFSSLLYSNYESLLLLRENITQILTTNQGKVEITFNASKLTTQNSNITISNDWYESVKLFFTEYQGGLS